LGLKKKAVLLQEDNILNNLIIDAIQDIKGKNIIKIDLRKLSDAPTNFFIICEGDSTTQVRAISENISKRTRSEMSVRPAHTEGAMSSKWVLVDYFDTVVHVFYRETREHYALEDLWSDGEITSYENLS
jgi:ribosome-associated protein